jgi:hypothetical protein
MAKGKDPEKHLTFNICILSFEFKNTRYDKFF